MNEHDRIKMVSQIQYPAAGFLLTVTGISAFDDNPVLGVTIGSIGLLLILFFIYVRISRKNNLNLKVPVLIAEGIAFLCTAYIFGSRGKIYLPWFYVLAAVGCIVAVIVITRKKAPLTKNEL